VRLLSLEEVMKATNVKSHVTLWTWIKEGHFPASRVIGKDGGHRSKRGWIDTEVYAHIANSPKRLPRGQQGGRVMSNERVSVYPPEFNGQEQINYWAVVRADGVGRDEGFRELLAANRAGEVWVAAENLTKAEAEARATELAADHPDRRYFVMPLPSRRQ
jgi:predicted DNA-binding transcriptional regulator AlpA